MADATYTPPAVWSADTVSDGRFASINRPIAGPTHDKELPVGKHPLQLYSLATPNGVKVSIMLEETGLTQITHDDLYSFWDYKSMRFQKNEGMLIDFQLATKPMFDRVQRAWLAAPPNPVDAWEVADGAYARWADDLRAADLPDRRPAWLRALWRRWDRRAGMPVPAEQSGAAA